MRVGIISFILLLNDVASVVIDDDPYRDDII
jgi:hypothetical protein